MVNSSENGSSVKCLSFPLSRVRYVTPPDAVSNQMLVTGSWMDKVNRLCLWQYGCGHLIDSGQFQPVSEQEDDVAPGVIGDSLDDPRLVHSLVHSGWVQDLKVHRPTEKIFTISSFGALQVFNFSSSGVPRLARATSSWIPFAPKFQVPYFQSIALSSLALSADASHVFLGDDIGRLALVDVRRLPKSDQAGCDSLSSTRSRASADACLQTGDDITTVNALERVDASLLASVNQLGQLKIWDVRCGLRQPQQRLLRPSYARPLQCLAQHPGQPHLFAVGGEETAGVGAYLWDLRADQYPLTEVACGGGTVWELHFHPRQPKHLYLATQTAGLLQISSRDDSGCWAGYKGSRKKLVMSSALPPGTNARDVISFDLSNTRLVCGHSDSVLHTVDCHVSVY